jgi:O-antigen ligase
MSVAHALPVDRPAARLGPVSASWLPLAWVWLLMLATFSVPGREAPTSAGALDPIALVKLVVRLGAALTLGGLLLLSASRPRGRAVLIRMLPFGAYLLWALLSAAWSPLPAVSVGQSVCLLVLLALAATVALCWHDVGSTSAVLGNLAGGLFVMSAIVLAAHILAPDTLALNRGELVDEGHSGLVHPSTASATAALGLIVLVAAVLSWGWPWARLLLGPGLLVHGGVLFFAASRTALAITLAIVVLTVCIGLARHVLAALVVALCLAGAAYLACDPGLELTRSASESISSYVQRGDSDESLSSFSGRTELWEVIWHDFLRSPWRGHGYFVTSAAGEIDVWGEPLNLTAHNLFLQVLSTTGLIGLALWLTALGTWAVAIVRGLRGRPDLVGLPSLLLLVCLWNVGWGLLSEGFMGALYPEAVAFFAIAGIALGSTLPPSRSTEAVEGVP